METAERPPKTHKKPSIALIAAQEPCHDWPAPMPGLRAAPGVAGVTVGVSKEMTEETYLPAPVPAPVRRVMPHAGCGERGPVCQEAGRSSCRRNDRIVEICKSGSMSGIWKRSHGRTTNPPSAEKGGTDMSGRPPPHTSRLYGQGARGPGLRGAKVATSNTERPRPGVSVSSFAVSTALATWRGRKVAYTIGADMIRASGKLTSVVTASVHPAQPTLFVTITPYQGGAIC